MQVNSIQNKMFLDDLNRVFAGLKEWNKYTKEYQVYKREAVELFYSFNYLKRKRILEKDTEIEILLEAIQEQIF